MKIVIVNQHTCNRGDEAAGRAVIESLSNAFPQARIDVLYKFDGIIPAIDQDSNLVKHYPNLVLQRWHIFGVLFNIVLLCLGSRRFFLGHSGKTFKKIQEADIVINAPTGPNMGDLYRDKIYMLNLLVAVLSNKPTYMYGSSVGPFQRWWIKRLSKFIFNRMVCVCVRDEISYKYLKDLNLTNKNIHCSLDAAVQRSIDDNNAISLYADSSIPLGKFNIGITPLSYQWYPKRIRTYANQVIVEKNMARILNKLIDKYDCNVIFFPQLFNATNSSNPRVTDLGIIESIIKLLSKPEKVFVLPQEYDSEDQQSMISKLDFFIGMRYHSIIFSTIMKIPCVGICYEHKARAFMKMAGLEELSIDIEEFLGNPDLVLEKVDYIDHKQETIRKDIEESLPALRSLSRKGTDLILSSLTTES